MPLYGWQACFQHIVYDPTGRIASVYYARMTESCKALSHHLIDEAMSLLTLRPSAGDKLPKVAKNKVSAHLQQQLRLQLLRIQQLKLLLQLTLPARTNPKNHHYLQ